MDASVSLLNLLEVSLPEGTARHQASDTKIDFLQENTKAGGVLLLDIDNSLFDDILTYAAKLEPVIMDTMEQELSTQADWMMGASSEYGIHEFNFGAGQSEYIAYLIRGRSACYLVWFDRSQIPYDVEKSIMESLHSEDITKELNQISNEAYVEAIAESMAAEDYTFEFNLPSGITRKDTSDSTALLYQNEKIVGGYNVVHFENGILPALQENKEFIFDYLQKNVMVQIEPADFRAEIANEMPITIVFSNDAKKYTHYILSYGHIGTQYDLWLDTVMLDQQTAENIMWSARLMS